MGGGITRLEAVERLGGLSPGAREHGVFATQTKKAHLAVSLFFTAYGAAPGVESYWYLFKNQ